MVMLMMVMMVVTLIMVMMVKTAHRYTRGRMAECYHKACDVWDPTTRSPDSPRFLAAVTKAVLESVLEMAEEEIIGEEVAEEDVMNKNVIEEDVIKEDVTEEEVMKEDKEKIMEETSTVKPVQSMEEASISARGSEVVPRKAFSRDILGQQ